MTAPTWRRGTRHSYLAHARLLAEKHGPGPWPSGGAPLPDADPSSQPLLTDTVLDGIRTHHATRDDGQDDALALAELIRARPVNLTALHDAAASVSPLDVTDDLVKLVRQNHRDDVRTAGRWLAENQLGLDFADRLTWHLSHHPYDKTLWFSLLDHHVGVAVELATRLLPLADLATGQGLELKEWGDNPASVLDLVVSRLSRHPGSGWPLIRTALSNATIRNRGMALNALQAWPPEDLPVDELRAAEAIEPDQDLRERIRTQLQRHHESR